MEPVEQAKFSLMVLSSDVRSLQQLHRLSPSTPAKLIGDGGKAWGAGGCGRGLVWGGVEVEVSDRLPCCQRFSLSSCTPGNQFADIHYSLLTTLSQTVRGKQQTKQVKASWNPKPLRLNSIQFNSGWAANSEICTMRFLSDNASANGKMMWAGVVPSAPKNALVLHKLCDMFLG